MGNFGGQISDTHPICGGVLLLLLLEIGLVVTITLIITVTIIIIIIIIVICHVILEYSRIVSSQ